MGADAGPEPEAHPRDRTSSAPRWPVLRRYHAGHLARIAMPIGGIGTGTVSLSGRGQLVDWELMNRPAKGFVPPVGLSGGPFFAVHVRAGGSARTRLLEGPLEAEEYAGAMGSRARNHGLPRFRDAAFEAAYPLAQVVLSDPDVPLSVRLQAMNPLVPGDTDASSRPIALLRWLVTNDGSEPAEVSVCATIPNFVGIDGTRSRQIMGFDFPLGADDNRNEYLRRPGLCGIHMTSHGVDPTSETFGSLAFAALGEQGVSHRTSWLGGLRWGAALLDFWDDLGDDGALDPRPPSGDPAPVASLAVKRTLAPGESGAFAFLLAWHFPNRQTWTPTPHGKNTIGNHYATRYADAWDALMSAADSLDELEARTVAFVDAFCSSDLPEPVKEAALFNLSTLRSQTCFRTPDGRFFGWEGAFDRGGCCPGSCTHVWNYEQALPFLFGDLARSMREVELACATDDAGLMSFRVHLPIERATEYGRAAADGQMGCVMKAYREWQLSGDDAFLRLLWPKLKAALAFAWIPGGWDADRDGVMEGCQHNTMDVEYYGPNPQMQGWYLGALRAAEEMADALGDGELARTCRALFERGSRWTDEHLWNGEYYEHEIRPPGSDAAIADGLRDQMGTDRLDAPELQLGSACLADQLVGQVMAHVCGLGHLLDPEHVAAALRSVGRYNGRASLHDHFNNMRSFALGDEPALLMASFPRGRAKRPFPYFAEAMSGFEYTAAVGMIQEGMREEGLRVIADVRARYDGLRRNPFDEAECGHHYVRAMASFGAVLALTGFRYSAVTGVMSFGVERGRHFFATGGGYGVLDLDGAAGPVLRVLDGSVELRAIELAGRRRRELPDRTRLRAGEALALEAR